MTAPVRLEPEFHEKLWGSTQLQPWFESGGRKIGEVWFRGDDRLLTKFIFTTERLSIQVHPDDERALAWEGCAGKTEMWCVLRAGPGAAIAVGFREPLESRDHLRQAALSGQIEQLVNWIPVRAGDVLFAPACTVHAIGAGLAVCEIQQNSDVTYRLYDYGRPRELHLEKAVEVADLGPHPGLSVPVVLAPGRRLLACSRYFATELIETAAPFEYRPDPTRPHILVAIEGSGHLAGESFTPGACWRIPPSAPPFTIDPQSPAKLLTTHVP